MVINDPMRPVLFKNKFKVDQKIYSQNNMDKNINQTSTGTKILSLIEKTNTQKHNEIFGSKNQSSIQTN